MNLKTEMPTIRVVLPLELEVVTIPSMIDYSSDLKKQKLLEEAFEAELETTIGKLLEKTQKELKGDPFEWSVTARRYFLRQAEYEAFNWRERYPHMKIDCQVDVRLTEFGKQLRTPDMRKAGE